MRLGAWSITQRNAISLVSLFLCALRKPASAFPPSPLLFARRSMSSLSASASSPPTLPSQLLRPLPMIDIGANLLDPTFTGMYQGKQRHPSDFERVLQRGVRGLAGGEAAAAAVDAGVCSAIIITAGTLAESVAAAKMAEDLNARCLREEGLPREEGCLDDSAAAHPDRAFLRGTGGRRFFTTCGVHPTRAGEIFTDADPTGAAYISSLSAFLHSQKSSGAIVALGEVGLDYDRLHFCDKETQLKALSLLLPLSFAHSLPLFLHNRSCGSDLLDLLRSNPQWCSRGGVVHSFDGPLSLASGFLSLGLHLGLNGCSVRGGEQHGVVRGLPLERILIETDAPWCDVRPEHASYGFVQSWKDQKGRDPKKFVPGETVKGRNEPMFLRWVLEAVAGIKGEEVGKCADIFFDNTRRVFFNNGKESEVTEVSK